MQQNVCFENYLYRLINAYLLSKRYRYTKFMFFYRFVNTIIIDIQSHFKLDKTSHLMFMHTLLMSTKLPMY
jgi:hypothetical protein